MEELGRRQPKQTSTLSLLYGGHTWELTDTIMEADKSQASSQAGSPRKANGAASAQGQQALVSGKAISGKVRRQEKIDVPHQGRQAERIHGKVSLSGFFLLL